MTKTQSRAAKAAAGLLALALGCKTVTAPRPAAPETPDQVRADFAAGKPVVVGIIGNSIGCGYYATGWQQIASDGTSCSQASEDNTAIQGWAQQLQVWLKAKNPGSKVWNMSQNGGWTDTVLASKIPQLLAAKSPKPSVVFIPLQVNDRGKASQNAPANNPPLPTWEHFKSNTVKICNILIAEGITPVLVKENNEPRPAGTGWQPANYWQGAQNGYNYHSQGEYADWIDFIANDDMWTKTPLGGPIEVIDVYSVTLRDPADPNAPPRFSVPTYPIPAPADFRSDIMDVADDQMIHPNQKGHNLILRQYENWFNGL